ncbi:uncharacterized protein METZ01_LOCUS100374, partial [marine metagenome]
VIGARASASPAKKSTTNTSCRIADGISFKGPQPSVGCLYSIGIGNRRKRTASHSANPQNQTPKQRPSTAESQNSATQPLGQARPR